MLREVWPVLDGSLGAADNHETPGPALKLSIPAISPLKLPCLPALPGPPQPLSQMYQWRQLRHGTLKPSPWTGGKVETRQRERAPRQDSRPGITLSSSSLAQKHAYIYKQDFFPLRLDESLWRVGRRWTARLVRAWLQAKNVHGNSAEISSWLSATYMLQPTHLVTGHQQMSVKNSLCT